MKYLLLFLVLLMTIGINLPDGMLARVGVDANLLTAALAALIIMALTVHRRLALIVLVVLLSLAANLPSEWAQTWGIDRDFMAGTLIALILTPYVARLFEGNI